MQEYLDLDHVRGKYVMKNFLRVGCYVESIARKSSHKRIFDGILVCQAQ